jgi:hypothetical protein
VLERIDSWKGEIKGKIFNFFIESLTENKVNINCCIDFGKEIDCLTHEVSAGMTRAEVEEFFANDPAFLVTWGRD